MGDCYPCAFSFSIFWGIPGKAGKICLFLVAPPLIYALLLTGSRSGLLCLIFTIGAIIWLSQNRKKSAVIALVICIPVAVYAVGILGQDLKTRYLSLVESNVVGSDTAKGRITGLIRAFSTISNNPVFGNGLGTSGEANRNLLGGRAQITHNLYLEVMQETGFDWNCSVYDGYHCYAKSIENSTE